MKLVRDPVVLFLATGLVALAVIAVGTSRLGQRAAADEAVADALAATEVLARSVAEPELPRGLVDARPAAIDRFDRTVLERLLVGDVRRIKLWSVEGKILYSDQTELIGEVFPLGEDERRVLAEDLTDAQISDLGRPENRYERGSDGLLEVYTRIESPEGDPLLFEVYFSADAVEARQRQIESSFLPTALGALGLVVLVATALLWVLATRLRRSADDRERLLRAAVDASDAERVRIARDLHDGVVQDLAGATYTVSAVARAEDLDLRHRATLDSAADSMRTGLRSLRSLMVEIYPPDLHTDGLASALTDLLAPAQARGIHAELVVDGVHGASDAAVALVWRVAQEVVRNALRHSACSTLVVSVRRAGGDLVLEARDDGRGFDPSAVVRPGHFGLRGLAGLVSDSGGSVEVDSATGLGTTVRARVPADTEPLRLPHTGRTSAGLR